MFTFIQIAGIVPYALFTPFFCMYVVAADLERKRGAAMKGAGPSPAATAFRLVLAGGLAGAVTVGTVGAINFITVPAALLHLFLSRRPPLVVPPDALCAPLPAERAL